MKNGQVTGPSEPRVTPIVYVDLDIASATEDEAADEMTDAEACGITAYPGLQAKLLTAHGPAGGNPIYRVEGPLPQLIKWLRTGYCNDEDELVFHLEHAGLAR